MKQTITIPGIVAPGLNGDDGLVREHWGQYQKRLTKYTWLIKATKPQKHSGTVRIIYMRQSIRQMDWDNASASFKAWGDALVKAGVIQDDKPSIVKRFIPLQPKAPSIDQQGTIIKIEDWDD